MLVPKWQKIASKKKRKKASLSLPQAKGQEPFWSEATCSINEGWEETKFYNISYHKLFYTMHCSYLQKNPKKEKNKIIKNLQNKTLNTNHCVYIFETHIRKNQSHPQREAQPLEADGYNWCWFWSSSIAVFHCHACPLKSSRSYVRFGCKATKEISVNSSHLSIEKEKKKKIVETLTLGIMLFSEWWNVQQNGNLCAAPLPV